MCTHSNNNALAFKYAQLTPVLPVPALSSLSRRSSPSPKPCGTRRACPLRGAWVRTGASSLPTARRLSTPAPLCGRAPDWLWCRPTYRENQKLSSALNSTRPQNRHQKNRPYSNDATKLSNRADKVDFERIFSHPEVPPQDTILYEGWLSQRFLCFRHVHSKNSCCL